MLQRAEWQVMGGGLDSATPDPISARLRDNLGEPAMPIPPEDINPMLDDAGTHVATARLTFRGGMLHQLYWPADKSTHDPEWRPVPKHVEAAPLPDVPDVPDV